jgi:hypothetical protein
MPLWQLRDEIFNPRIFNRATRHSSSENADAASILSEPAATVGLFLRHTSRTRRGSSGFPPRALLASLLPYQIPDFDKEL